MAMGRRRRIPNLKGLAMSAFKVPLPDKSQSRHPAMSGTGPLRNNSRTASYDESSGRAASVFADPVGAPADRNPDGGSSTNHAQPHSPRQMACGDNPFAARDAARCTPGPNAKSEYGSKRGRAS